MNKLVFQSDFGLVDGAVSAMKGISYKVSSKLIISDLTHDIPPFNVWEGSYRLFQTVDYWPVDTVFVSVVDPGVGSERISVVAKLVNNKYIVTPNNGTLTHLAITNQILELREIDENKNRLEGSEESYTFHGRDVYAFTGARLASGIIDYPGVGPKLDIKDVVKLPLIEPVFTTQKVIGSIDILDIRFGSLWTNISSKMFKEYGFNYGDRMQVKIIYKDRILYNNIVRFGKSFSEVNIGETIIYVNSLLYISLAINQGNFARAYNVGTGINWIIEFEKYHYER